MTGIALLEIACWDIIGKALGQPVYRLLGGRHARQDSKPTPTGWVPESNASRKPGMRPPRKLSPKAIAL